MSVLRTIAMALLLVVNVAVTAADRITIRKFPASEFSPARGGEFQIPFRIKDAATVNVKVYAPDGQLVRTLEQMFEAGDGVITWNGRDEHGSVVLDEAYAPVISATFADGKSEHIDARETSAGETFDHIPMRIVNDHDIQYRLPSPGRVVIRLGIAGGPMIRELASWEPRGAGAHIQRWDGRDADGVKGVAGKPGLRILVAAYKLPEFSIITRGNALTGNGANYSGHSWEDITLFTPGPVFAKFGPVANLDTSLNIPAGTVFRHSFDVSKPAVSGQTNRTLESAARFMNMHARAGVAVNDVNIAVVVHGQAVHDVTGKNSASVELVAALTAKGVRIIVCGQSATYYGVTKADLLPGVEVALSAMTAHALLQQNGYTLNPF